MQTYNYATQSLNTNKFVRFTKIYKFYSNTVTTISSKTAKDTCTVKLCTTLNQRQLKPMLQDYNSIRSRHYQHSRVLNNKLSVWHQTTKLSFNKTNQC